MPTPETIPLTLPDSLNPRYSYGGSKIISELIAFNYARDYYRKVQVFRPHNVYGPDMGWKHVVPQFIVGALKARRGVTWVARRHSRFRVRAPRPGHSATSTTSLTGFAMYPNGGHREIYHIGNDEEVSIRDLAGRIGGDGWG